MLLIAAHSRWWVKGTLKRNLGVCGLVMSWHRSFNTFDKVRQGVGFTWVFVLVSEPNQIFYSTASGKMTWCHVVA